MPYELWIGFRYLRARRREAFISLITMISIIGVTISVTTLDVALAVMTGFETDLRTRILGFSPHVVVTSYTGPIREEQEALEAIRSVPGVEKAEPFIYVQAMISSGPAVTGVYVRAVEPSRASDVVDIGQFLFEGSFEMMGRRRPVTVATGEGGERSVELSGVVIGSALARDLGVGIGDVVTLFSPLGSPSPVGMIPRVKRFAVVGFFRSGMFEFDQGLVYMAIDDAQRLFGMGDAVSGIEVRANDLDEADVVADRIQLARLGFPFEARNWKQMNRNIFVALELEKLVYFLVLTLMLVVAGFTILATLIMVVMEKRKDIAILKSMGATDRAIARIFVLKGMVIGLIGIVLGNLGGVGISWLISKYELPLPEGVFFVANVPVVIVPQWFAAVSAAALAICFLVTLYPAARASRVAPVDVIRYE